MVGGVAFGWAGVDDQIDELTALGGDRLGGLGAKSLVLVGGQRLFGEDVDDDAGRGGFHGRTMHRGHGAIKQAQTPLSVLRQAVCVPEIAALQRGLVGPTGGRVRSCSPDGQSALRTTTVPCYDLPRRSPMASHRLKIAVPNDRRLVVQLPDDMEPGEVIVTLHQTKRSMARASDFEFPTLHVKEWPKEWGSLRREDMYGDDGR